MSSRRKTIQKLPKHFCPVAPLQCINDNERAEGIVFWQNKRYIVSELIVGESAWIHVYYEDANQGYARAIKLDVSSPSRALPLGHPKMALGSYHLAHMHEADQDLWKNQRIQQIFPGAQPIIVGKRAFYRNKVVLFNGGFHASGQGRKQIVVPGPGVFDLMAIDFTKYVHRGDWIIRRLETEISGAPGTQLNTTDTVLGKRFQVNLNSFYQVNSEMAEIVYRAIISYIPKHAIVFDLFAGAAVIGIHVADTAKRVYSVEIANAAIADAKRNLTLNHITNLELVQGDANEFVLSPPEMPTTIIVDPPRSGLNEAAMTALNGSGAKQIIYLSCNILTQARDVALLTNYKTTLVQPYDFFPQTYHIENLMILELK